MNTPTMSEQLLEAASLLMIGMLTVFIFLSVLIISVKLITKFVEVFPEPEATTHQPARPAPAVSSQAVNAQASASVSNQKDVITAITHAVTAYRQTNQPSSK
ncbi:MAG: oxaloacetate decarboxylase gamma chain [Glaciecola sp. HTCC2999]|jgi:oxaloacetate decarboxylase gamma subunit|nr:MAG: oxaloacetate decarboxylase gamma chain [Glaciecola sp. HTCC2999]